MRLADCEKLLHLISIYGDLSTTKFYELFDRLYPAYFELDEYERYFIRFQVLRFLEALGHCEYDHENRRLYACEPIITLQSSWGLPQAILSGARLPSLITKLREFASQNKKSIVLEELNQPYYPVLPTAVILKATSLDILAGAAAHLNIECKLDAPASWVLLHFSNSVQQVQEQLKFETRADLNWAKLIFSTKLLTFTNSSVLKGRTSLAEYTNTTSHRKQHLLWLDGQCAIVERDWGRYLILFIEKINVLSYSKKKFQLAVPATTPLPTIIARAVTFKAGVIPVEKTINKRKYFVYGNVDQSFANLVAEKLGQLLLEM